MERIDNVWIPEWVDADLGDHTLGSFKGFLLEEMQSVGFHHSPWIFMRTATNDDHDPSKNYRTITLGPVPFPFMQ